MEERQLFLELLGILADATKTITELLRVAPAQVPLTQDQSALLSQVAQEVEHVAAAVIEQAVLAAESPAQEIAQEEPAEPASPRRRTRLTITESELQKLYLEEDLPAREIALRYGVSAAVINNRLRFWKILKRGARRSGAVPVGGELQGQEASTENAVSSRTPHHFEPDPNAVQEAEAAFKAAEVSYEVGE